MAEPPAASRSRSRFTLLRCDTMCHLMFYRQHAMSDWQGWSVQMDAGLAGFQTRQHEGKRPTGTCRPAGPPSLKPPHLLSQLWELWYQLFQHLMRPGLCQPAQTLERLLESLFHPASHPESNGSWRMNKRRHTRYTAWSRTTTSMPRYRVAAQVEEWGARAADWPAGAAEAAAAAAAAVAVAAAVAIS